VTMNAQSILPRLRVGAGASDGTTGLCGMQVISWESGDTTITDLPACADPVLARIAQNVNDRICTHRTGDLLCPACSVLVLALAHRTVGTGGPADLDRRRVWVRIAADQARQVLHLARDRAAAEAAIVAAEAAADNPTAAARAAARAAAAYAATAAAVAVAVAVAAVAAAAATAAAADTAAASAATIAAAAAYAVADTDDRLRLAHRAIDTFNTLTGHTEQQPDPGRTTAAYTAMTTPR
jgi:hypothetical protein